MRMERGRILRFDIESGGGWALIRRALPVDNPGASSCDRTRGTCAVATLWGRVLASAGTGSDLLRVYRRLEACGEIRGVRFVGGFSGEQYALPEAIGFLRKTRRRPHSEQWISLSGADPQS